MVCVICLAYCNIPGGFFSTLQSRLWDEAEVQHSDGECYISFLPPFGVRKGNKGEKFFSPEPIFSRKKGVFFIIIIN